MAKQSDFINKISDFTKSLESLVEILKEQNKVSPTEIVNKLLENLDSKGIEKITKNLDTIKKNTENISKQVDKTLKAIKEQKKAKETGMFGQVDDKKNKKSIVDGVKTVILIAVGVLAIGMAFKMVGVVDFLSVVALGLGIVFVAHAFAKVASIRDDKGKEIGLKRAGVVSLIMIIMAGALLISGLLLYRMPVIGLFQVLSVIGVGLAIGVATWLMIKALHHLKMSTIPKMLLLPLILPAIAAGLVLAGLVLKNMPIISFKQMMSALGVGIAMVPVAFAFSIITRAMKSVTLKDIIKSSLIMPAMAVGIVLASYILTNVQKIDFWTVVKTSIAVGIATLAMAPAVMFLEKAGLLKPKAYKELLIASAIIPLMSLSLVAASFILLLVQKFDYEAVIYAALSIGLLSLVMAPSIILLQKAGLLKQKAIKELLIAAAVFPLISLSIVLSSIILLLLQPVKWEALQTGFIIGLIVLAMLPTILLLDKFGLTKPSAIMQLVIAAGAIVLISTAIMLSSWVLSVGNYTNAPDWKWSLGAGLSIIMFTPAVVFLGLVVMSGVGLLALGAGAIGVLLVAATVVATSYILSAGSYGNFPSLGWALGSGVSMIAFGLSMLILGTAILLTAGIGYIAMLVGASAIKLVAETVVATSAILSSGSYGTYPTFEWALGSGLSMIAFGAAMLTLGTLILATGGIGFIALGIGGVACLIVASTVVATSYILAAGSYDKYPTLGWALGSGMSMILFGTAMMVLGTIILLSFGLGMLALEAGQEAMYIVAATVVGTSYILGMGSYDKYPTAGWILGVGVTMIGFATAMVVLGILLPFLMLGALAVFMVSSVIVKVTEILGAIDYDTTKVPSTVWSLMVLSSMALWTVSLLYLSTLFIPIMLGATSMLVVASTIYLTALILSKADYEGWNKPKIPWSFEVLTSIVMFTGVMLALALFIVPLFIGSLAMLLVAGTITLTSMILSAGNYSNFPSISWSSNVAASILAIGMPMMAFGAFIIGSFGLGLIALESGLAAFLIIATNITLISAILNNGKYEKFPSLQWVMGVSQSLMQFSLLGLTIPFNEESMRKLFYVAFAIRSYSLLLSSISTDYSSLFGGGADDISKKISTSMQELVKALPKKEEIEPIWLLIGALHSLANVPWEEIMNIQVISGMIGYLSSQLDNINERKVGALAQIGAGLHIMAIVDQNKLNATLKVLEDRSKVLSQIFDGSSFIQRVFDNAEKMVYGRSSNNASQSSNQHQDGNVQKSKQTESDTKKEKFQEELLIYIKNIDTNIGKMSEFQKTEQEESLKSKNVEDAKEGKSSAGGLFDFF